ncbi:MAG: hypothetical protein ABI567_11985 [Gammaproteobacteria bacterium]
MVTASGELTDGVTVIRGPADPDDLALPTAASLLAEITHLPTGTGSGLSEFVTLLPGANWAGVGVNTPPALIRVLSGRIRLSWGRDPGHSATAHDGDTAMLPAGIAFAVRNESPGEGASFILVRGE